jgi:alkaline phosphatase
MPRGRSTFNKRQKEQARQQKQRDKNEKKTQRKQDQPEGVTVVDEEEELRQMREHAAEQAALFGIGSDEDEPGSTDLLPPHGKQAQR